MYNVQCQIYTGMYNVQCQIYTGRGSAREEIKVIIKDLLPQFSSCSILLPGRRRIDAPNECSTQQSAPWRKESAPWRKESAPWRKQSAPWRKESAPWRKESAPWRKESAPWRKQSTPWRKDIRNLLNSQGTGAPVATEVPEEDVVAMGKVSVEEATAVFVRGVTVKVRPDLYKCSLSGMTSVQ